MFSASCLLWTVICRWLSTDYSCKHPFQMRQSVMNEQLKSFSISLLGYCWEIVHVHNRHDAENIPSATSTCYFYKLCFTYTKMWHLSVLSFSTILPPNGLKTCYKQNKYEHYIYNIHVNIHRLSLQTPVSNGTECNERTLKSFSIGLLGYCWQIVHVHIRHVAENIPS
jgi:hypothetical protein